MNIKEIARESGLSQQTILSYINKGIISPERVTGEYIFSDQDLQRLAAIASVKDSQDEPISSKKPQPTTAEEAIELVKRNKRIAVIKTLILPTILLIITFTVWWNYYRTLTMTVTFPTAKVSALNFLDTGRTTSTQANYISQTSDSDFPFFFAVRITNQKLFYRLQVGVEYSEVVIQVRVPLYDAREYNFLIEGTNTLDQDKIINAILNDKDACMKYVFLKSVKE